MASLVWFEEGNTVYWKERTLLEGGMRAKAYAGSMVATVSLKPPHPRAPYEVGSWQMLASTTLVWSSGVSVIGRKASKASFPSGRMDRAICRFPGLYREDLATHPGPDVLLCTEKLSTPDSPLIMFCF